MKKSFRWCAFSLFSSDRFGGTGHYPVAEDASFFIGVVQFCTKRWNPAAATQKHLGSNQHAKRWRHEIKPECMPVFGMQCWSKTSGRIHAHPGKRCLQDNESRVQETNQVGCVAG